MTRPVDVKALFNTVAAAEKSVLNEVFLAPVVRGGKVRTSVQGIVYEFTLRDKSFEGWAVLRPTSPHTVRIEEEPSTAQVRRYLSLFPSVHMILLSKREDCKTHSAYPGYRESSRKKFGIGGETFVNLVENGAEFQWVKVAFDGSNMWYVGPDRGHSAVVSNYLTTCLGNETAPEEIRYHGMLPEERMAYSILFQERIEGKKSLIERRLEGALNFAGAVLISHVEKADHFAVRWREGQQGKEHVTAVAKTDLTVISSGICLSGRDRDFDLTSLVGVMRRQNQSGVVADRESYTRPDITHDDYEDDDYDPYDE